MDVLVATRPNPKLPRPEMATTTARMKRFFEWVGLKQRLHDTEHQPALVTDREIWWASIGEDVSIFHTALDPQRRSFR